LVCVHWRDGWGTFSIHIHPLGPNAMHGSVERLESVRANGVVEPADHVCFGGCHSPLPGKVASWVTCAIAVMPSCHGCLPHGDSPDSKLVD
jgi:hypothetical protein